MDIMMPSLGQQPAPAPWLAHRNKVDARGVVAAALAQNPSAGIDEIAAELRRRGAEMPAPLVAELIQACKAS